MSVLVEMEQRNSDSQSHIPAHWIKIPTGYDLQVHLRFPGQKHKETLLGGLTAAYLGGYDEILTMPNTVPFLDTPERLAKAKADFKNQEHLLPPVKVGFSAAATLDMKGETPADILGLVKSGATAITDDGWGVKSEAAMLRILELCRDADVPFLQHAEMPGHGGVATASAFQVKHGLPEYPRLAESNMVKRDIELLKKVKGARYHVLHISTLETLEVVKQAKQAGLNITCEVTPHHLLVSNTSIPDETSETSTYYKMNPPIFSENDRLALVKALADGYIDIVSTDHAPHESELKKLGWLKAPFGTRGLQTALPALLTLYNQGHLSLERINEIYSLNARKILSVQNQAPTGYLLVDPFEKWIFKKEHLAGVSENSIFIGSEFIGRIKGRFDPQAGFKLFSSN